MAKSIFNRGGNGMTTGGLDGYLGPEAQDHSNLPEHIEEVDKDATPPTANPNEPVNQIAKAEKEVHPKPA